MAIWEAIVGSEKKRLDGDGALYLLQVHGVGLPPARRLKVRSPQQHGSTDIGYRYDEREMRLAFYFNAKNPAGAVAKRDELYGFWKALEATPIQLRYTRDDASVRQIDCHVTGVVDMPWDPDRNQMGQQDFVVQVEAANPMWYNPTQQSTSFTEADNLDWWLALGTIAADNVLTYVESPAQNAAIAAFTSVANNSPWTVFLRTNAATIPPAGEEAAYILWSNDYIYLSSTAWMFPSGENFFQTWDGGLGPGGAFATGESDYFAVSNGTLITWYRNTGSIGANSSTRGIDGSRTDRNTWRGEWWGRAWTPAIPNGAIFNTALTTTQRNSLVAAIDGGYAASKTITYTGSFRAFPVITILGPITDPVLTNVSTGEDLDFTGITIAGGDSYTIDCRFGYKTVKNAAGTNKIADLSSGSDLATFHLGADPEVSDGANAFTLTGTGTDSNTQVTVAYYERFVGA